MAADSSPNFRSALSRQSRIKPRHAAALALVGWYLMVPPAIPNTGEVNKSAPLAQWTIRRTFPRNAGCENAKSRLRTQALAAQADKDAAARRGLRNSDSRCIVCNAECVSTDDARLGK